MSSVKKPIIFYGWIVLALGFLAMMVAYGLRYNFSVFYDAILEDFGWARGATAAALSINLIIYALSAPISGSLADRFGIRKIVPLGAVLLGLALAACNRVSAIWQLYLFVGLTSFGSCAVGFVPHTLVIANWFSRRRGLALGILNAGIIASALLAPGVEYLIATLSWRGAFLVFAGVSAVILAPLAAIFQRQRPEDKGLKADGAGEESTLKEQSISYELIVDKEWALQDWTLARAVKTARFWWLAMLFLLWGLYAYTFIVHQVPYLTDAGYTRAFAARIVSIFGALGVAGSVCTFISDRIGREFTFTLASGSALAGVIVIMLIQNTLHPWMPYLYGVLFGFPLGLCSGVALATAADLFQGKHFGAIMGVLVGLLIGGGAIGPWLAGYIFDVTGNYAQAFPLIYFSVFASAAFIWLAAPRKVRKVRYASR